MGASGDRGKIEARLAERGIVLPEAPAPAANYVPFVISRGHLWIAGQLPFQDGTLRHKGRLGEDCDVEDAVAAARICAINIMAQAKAALGGLDRVAQVVKLVGFVNSAPAFTDQPKVVNGASDLIVDIFGDRGRHARSAVGVAVLPLGASVEVEAVIEIG